MRPLLGERKQVREVVKNPAIVPEVPAARHACRNTTLPTKLRSSVLHKLGKSNIQCSRKLGKLIERDILTSAFHFRKIGPAQICFFRQLFQGHARVGSAGADVTPHDLPMVDGMSHWSTSKPESTSNLKDERLAMPFVVPKRIEAHARTNATPGFRFTLSLHRDS